MAKYLAIFLAAALAWASPARGQLSASAADSLSALAETAPDTALPMVYYQLSQQLRYNKPLKGITYAMKMIDLAEIQKKPYYLALGYCAMAVNERNSQMNQHSLEHYNMALACAQEYAFTRLEGNCYNSIARVALDLGLKDSAEHCVAKALEIGKALNDTVVLADAYMNFGIICRQKGLNDRALRYLSMSYKLRNMLQELSLEGLVPLWHLSGIYMERGEFEKAKELMHKNLNRAELSSWHMLLSTIWYRLAQVYYKTRDLDSAEFACNKAKTEAIQCQNFRCLAQSFRLFDSIYIQMNNYRKAADYCNRFMNICDNVFNQQIDAELNKIQYSPEYLKNQKSIADSNHGRTASLLMVALSVMVLIVVVFGIHGIISRSQNIKALNDELSSKKESMDRSLEYTRAIQMAVQPRVDDDETVFSDYAILYIPRDIVSGDFFWKYSDSRYEIIAVADCTGHGVPGAMLTMLGVSMLQDIATSGIRESGAILKELRARIKMMMGVNGLNRMQDGMDISLVTIDKQTMVLDFAGAFNSLMHVRGGQMSELKATRCPIGEYIKERNFESQYIQLEKGDCIFMATDGFTSQFGGPEKSKMPLRRLRELIMEHQGMPMASLRDFLAGYFAEWKGSCDQVDDVTVAGFRV